MRKLLQSYYLKKDVVEIAQSLIGKVLYTNFNGQITAGIINETEAYTGINDKASHSYNGRRTERNESMYSKGGIAYVYLCYGIHYLFNVVTNEADHPQAVLVRSIVPYLGMKTMEERRKMKHSKSHFSDGPGKLTKALGINLTHNWTNLNEDSIWISDESIKIDAKLIQQTPRIGIDYAGEDAALPYRFLYDKSLLK